MATETQVQMSNNSIPPGISVPPAGEDSGTRMYNGDLFRPPAVEEASVTPPPFTTPGNQRIVRRKVSPFNVVASLFLLAIGIVLYISNIIAVDQLMNETNALENQHRQIVMEQEVLKMQINRMSSLERIRERAEQELGLKTPNEPPVLLHVDPERVQEIQKALQE